MKFFTLGVATIKSAYSSYCMVIVPLGIALRHFCYHALSDPKSCKQDEKFIPENQSHSQSIEGTDRLMNVKYVALVENVTTWLIHKTWLNS